jgi:hypothetical protein
MIIITIDEDIKLKKTKFIDVVEFFEAVQKAMPKKKFEKIYRIKPEVEASWYKAD